MAVPFIDWSAAERILARRTGKQCSVPPASMPEMTRTPEPGVTVEAHELWGERDQRELSAVMRGERPSGRILPTLNELQAHLESDPWFPHEMAQGQRLKLDYRGPGAWWL